MRISNKTIHFGGWFVFVPPFNHKENRKTIMSNKTPVGSVLVVGGGITGMQSALDLAEAGYYVYLVEESPAIGGAMAQLDKTFPTNDCSM